MSSLYTFDPNRAADLLNLLSNEARLTIIQHISEREWDVNSLATKTDLSQSALSQHLKKMRDLKVVRTRRDAQTIYYSCHSEEVAKVLAALNSIYRQSEPLEHVA